MQVLEPPVRPGAGTGALEYLVRGGGEGRWPRGWGGRPLQPSLRERSREGVRACGLTVRRSDGPTLRGWAAQRDARRRGVCISNYRGHASRVRRPADLGGRGEEAGGLVPFGGPGPGVL